MSPRVRSRHSSLPSPITSPSPPASDTGESDDDTVILTSEDESSDARPSRWPFPPVICPPSGSEPCDGEAPTDASPNFQ